MLEIMTMVINKGDFGQGEQGSQEVKWRPEVNTPRAVNINTIDTLSTRYHHAINTLSACG